MTGSVPPLDLGRPLVVGFGITGRAVAAALLRRGHRPVVVDDRPGSDAVAAAEELGVEFVDAATLEDLVAGCTVVLPSPGVPDHHPVFAAARSVGCPVRSEFDLPAEWDDRPLVAITGTNGKTTVTMLVADALERSGITAAAVGNTDLPLVAAIDDPATEVFVVEASSFRLGHSGRFSPRVATWTNFAPDHLDAHASLEHYRAAKASIWTALPTDGVAVANVEDPVVAAAVPADRRVVTFGLAAGDWHVGADGVVGPDGLLVEAARLPRRLPHDLVNVAAAAATAVAAGADPAAVAAAAIAFDGLPHRVTRVGEWQGVAWYDDSKATVPQATVAGLGGFDSVVLIAGGRNKGVDLTPLATTVPPVHTVVALGEAGPEISAAFAGCDVTVVPAPDMAVAVDAAAAAARPGDAVVLSPACTSFDQYPNYAARGDHFAALVLERSS